MDDLALVNITGNDEVDRMLRLVIGGFEREFPGLFRGYYVIGSYATGTALPASDLDLLFEGRVPDPSERERSKVLLDTCRAATPLDGGVFPMIGEALHGIYNPIFKLKSLFLYGHDMRDTIPLVPPGEWARQCMHGIYRVMGRNGTLTQISYPIDYPDPQGEFYGYDDTVRLPDGSEVKGTRGLVTGAGWLATSLIGLKARCYVLSKGEFAASYRQHVGDEWAPFLDDLYDSCRRRWNYLIPQGAEDRAKLRLLCERYLQFENQFLAVYRDFVLAELQRGDDSAMLQALRTLERLPYDDAEIKAAVDMLQNRRESNSGKAGAE